MTDQEPMTPEATPETLRALSNVVRWQAYAALHALGPQRARDVAELCGVLESSMSRHLNILRELGFVDVEERGRDRRSWIWTARRGGVRVSRLEGGELDAAGWDWVQAVIGAQGVQATRWAQVAMGWPQDWRTAAEVSDWNMYLTASQLDEFGRKLHEFVREWKQRISDPNEAVWKRGQDAKPGEPDWISPCVVITDAVPFPRELPRE